MSGIKAEDRAVVILDGCHISGNEGAGIDIDGASRLRMTGGCLEENRGAGLRAQTGASIAMSHVRISENAGPGIEIKNRRYAFEVANQIVEESDLLVSMKGDIKASLLALRDENNLDRRIGRYERIMSLLSDHITVASALSPYMIFLASTF